MARAVTVAPLDAHTDLEFSLDGSTWTDAPDLVLGSWGCDLDGGPVYPDPSGAIGGTADVDPCSMSPGESVTRSYHVRNVTDTGRAGRYEVGIGDYVVSDEAEFDVSSAITGWGDSDTQTVTLFGADTPQAADSAAPGSTVAALDLAPGQTATVVDEVSVPVDPQNYAQKQSVTPMIWVSFSDIGVIDTDGDGLPDADEDQLGTDPLDPHNRLPGGAVGQGYGPEPFLPTPPQGTGLEVDLSTLPPGMRIEGGDLVGNPTRAGTFDIAFTVTMPGGATYTSIRRVVIDPGPGGGSSNLPDIIGPIVIIGIIIGVFGPALGSLGGSVGGSLGSLLDPSDSSDSTTDSPSTSAGQIGEGQSGTGQDGTNQGGTAQDDTGQAGTGQDGTGQAGTGQAGTGQVAVNSITPRDGAPSEEWARANSQVRGALPETGVGAADLLLWALTAAAAGATLILLTSRRRQEPED